MKKGIALLLSVAMAFTMMMGCGKKDSGENGKTELTVGVGAQFTTMDPGLNTEVVNSYVLNHTSAGLFTVDEKGTVLGKLAEDYEVSEDGLTYTVTLKDGLKWSDGQDLVASDFVFGVKRNLTYGAENAWAVYYLGKYLDGASEYMCNSELEAADLADWNGVEATDDKTLVYHLTSPCAFFPRLLTSGVFEPLREDVVDAHSSEWAFGEGYPTCGPYTLESINENEKAVVVKNENYFDADSITVDKITFLVMTDADAQTAAFKTGDLDCALGVNANITQAYEDQDAVWKLPSAAVYFVAMNSGETGPEELKDVNVRRALALAIDKEAIAGNLGDLYSAIYGYVPHGLSGVSGDYRDEGDALGKMLEYDPDEAKALLAEAGYSESNPLSLIYKYSDSQLHADVAQLLQEQWKAVGINVELEVVESGVFYDQLDNGNFELARYGYVSATDASVYLDLWTTGQQIVAAVDDEKFDQMVADAAYITDPAEYYDALHEAESYLVEEMVYIIPLFNYGDAGLLSTDIEGEYCSNGSSAPFFGYCTFAEAE